MLNLQSNAMVFCSYFFFPYFFSSYFFLPFFSSYFFFLFIWHLFPSPRFPPFETSTSRPKRPPPTWPLRRPLYPALHPMVLPVCHLAANNLTNHRLPISTKNTFSCRSSSNSQSFPSNLIPIRSISARITLFVTNARWTTFETWIWIFAWGFAGSINGF